MSTLTSAVSGTILTSLTSLRIAALHTPLALLRSAGPR